MCSQGVECVRFDGLQAMVLSGKRWSNGRSAAPNLCILFMREGRAEGETDAATAMMQTLY